MLNTAKLEILKWVMSLKYVMIFLVKTWKFGGVVGLFHILSEKIPGFFEVENNGMQESQRGKSTQF